MWFILQTTMLALAKSAAKAVTVTGSAILPLIPWSRMGRQLMWARPSRKNSGFAGLLDSEAKCEAQNSNVQTSREGNAVNQFVGKEDIATHVNTHLVR